MNKKIDPDSIYSKLRKHKGKVVMGTLVPLVVGGVTLGINNVNKAHANLNQDIYEQPKIIQPLEDAPSYQEKYLSNLTHEQRLILFESLNLISPAKPKGLEDLLNTSLPETELERLTLPERAHYDLIKKNPKLFTAVAKSSKKTGFDYGVLSALVTRESGISMLYQNGKTEKDVGFKFESKKGARGPGGIKKDLLTDYNRANPNSQYTFDDMFDYGKNLDVAVWNLKRLMKKYKNKLHLALLAFNKGMTGVDDIIKEAKTTDFKTIYSRSDRTVKRGLKKYAQQRDYVGAILGIWRYLDSIFEKIGMPYKPQEEITEYLHDVDKYPRVEPIKKSKKYTISPYLTKPYGYKKAA